MSQWTIPLYRLVRTLAIDLSVNPGPGPDVRAYDVTFDPADGSALFVATDGGAVMHASVHPDHRPSPR